MNSLTIFRKITDQLTQIYDLQEAKNIALLLLEKTCHLRMIDIISGSKTISEHQINTLQAHIEGLQAHTPIQYVLGEAYFFDLQLEVNKDTLIPRGETMELVLLIKNMYEASPAKKIIDIGTGSGCIAIALADFMPQHTIYGVDISAGAIAVAKRNAEKYNKAIEFFEIDILTNSLDSLPLLDIIVSNPPYVTEVEKAAMKPNVLDFEPHTALFVPDDNPLLFYKRIAEIAKQKLMPEGKLFFEINEQYGRETADMLEKLDFKNVQIVKDLNEKDRIIWADNPSS
jgi:release factor glutamine methyltransferase